MVYKYSTLQKIKGALILILSFYSSFSIAQNTNNLNNILNNIFSNVEQIKQKSQKDSMLEELTRQNPEFIEFSKQYEETNKEIEDKLSKTAPASVQDCALKKFKFKNVCLGITLEQFSKIYTLSSDTMWDAAQLRKNGIRLVEHISNRAERRANCRYQSPSVNTDGVYFPLPYSYKLVECKTSTETLFGLNTSSVDYTFINDRLYKISIDLINVGVLNMYHDQYKSSYQKYFDESSQLNEIISSVIDQKYTESNVIDLNKQSRNSNSFYYSKWINQSDSTIFAILSNTSTTLGNSVLITHPDIDGLIVKARSDVSNFNKNKTKAKQLKDF